MQAAQEREDDMIAYKRDLMKQKTDKVEQNKREHDEENMNDKKRMEGVMNRIAEEDLESTNLKLEMKDKMRCEMLECQDQRKKLIQQEKSFATQEDQRIRDENFGMIDRDAVVSAQRAEKFEQKERTNERIMCAIHEEKAEAQRRGDLVELLRQQERVEKYEQDEMSQNEELEQSKRAVNDTLMWQIQYKADAAAEERVRDAQFMHTAQEQMLKEDEEDRDKEVKKRDAQEKYDQELQQQILENAVRRNNDLEANKSYFNSD